MKTGLQFTVTQFRAIFILWTILAIFFGGSIIYSAYTIIEGMVLQDSQFKRFPVFIITLFLMGILLPLNVLLFYVSHFKVNKTITKILNILPLIVIPLFTYWVICISNGLAFNDFVWIGLFIGSYVLVRLNQNRYISELKAPKK